MEVLKMTFRRVGNVGGSRIGRRWPHTYREVAIEWSIVKELCSCKNAEAQEDSF